MRLLVFSDTHLTKKFDSKKFAFLSRIIDESDRVIINGDFWEGHINSFGEFIDSEWKALFPLLKKRNAVYLFGNHDLEEYCNENVSLFSDVQSHKYHLELYGKVFHFEHGHELMPSLDSRLKQKRILKTIVKRAIHIEQRIVRDLGKHALKRVYKTSNKRVKLQFDKTKNDEDILVCGHTHIAEIDMQNRFINSGFIRHGLGQYLLFEDNTLSIKESWYNPPRVRARLSPHRYFDRGFYISV